MYLDHFGLTQLPFGITPDTEFAFATRSHQQALNTLLVALAGGEGFVKIVGEVGTGKTLLCRRLLASLDPGRYVTAYVPNPLLDAAALLAAIAEELAPACAPSVGEPHHLLKRLNSTLLDHAARGQQVVILIDEAQALPLATLEALRLLSNLETEKRKLLQIVLFGQPELEVKLADTAVRQLRQRITFSSRLEHLDRDEFALYLEHRLRVGGYRGKSLFSSPATAKLRRASGGMPRLVNSIAHKALLLAFGEGAQQVRRRHVALAAADGRVPAVRWGWGALALLSLSAAAGVWAMTR
jgi:MSHA biogenesis protein MshM